MDDLSRITGIGPATVKRLAEAGIQTFAALAALDDATAENLGVQAEWRQAADELASQTTEAEGPGTAIGASVPPPPDPAATPAGAGGEVPVLVVVGPERGRRRAGMRFGAQPQVLPLHAMHDHEIAAIEGDPALKVKRETRPRKGAAGKESQPNADA